MYASQKRRVCLFQGASRVASLAPKRCTTKLRTPCQSGVRESKRCVCLFQDASRVASLASKWRTAKLPTPRQSGVRESKCCICLFGVRVVLNLLHRNDAWLNCPRRVKAVHWSLIAARESMQRGHTKTGHQKQSTCTPAGCAGACPDAWEVRQRENAYPHGSSRADPLVSFQRDEVLAARGCGRKCSAPRRARAAPPAREVQAILACTLPRNRAHSLLRRSWTLHHLRSAVGFGGGRGVARNVIWLPAMATMQRFHHR